MLLQQLQLSYCPSMRTSRFQLLTAVVEPDPELRRGSLLDFNCLSKVTPYFEGVFLQLRRNNQGGEKLDFKKESGERMTVGK